jgi:flagellar hook protein FlgE
MANSLLTGISGLRGHQKMLEVVGNNLANLNTTSFKASRVLFSDLMYELQRGASSTSTQLLGSVNAVQIGTGSRVSQVAKDFQQGNLEASGKPSGPCRRRFRLLCDEVWQQHLFHSRWCVFARPGRLFV